MFDQTHEPLTQLPQIFIGELGGTTGMFLASMKILNWVGWLLYGNFNSRHSQAIYIYQV